MSGKFDIVDFYDKNSYITTFNFLRDNISIDTSKAYPKLLLQLEKFRNISTHKIELDNFLLFFREYIYTNLFMNGEIFDKDFLYLYRFYTDLSEDNKISTNIKFFSNILNDYSSDTPEYLTITTLIYNLYILNGQEKIGFRFFLKHIMITNTQNNDIDKLINVIIDISKYIEFDLELYIDILKNDIFNMEYYVSLNKLQQRSISNWFLHIFWSNIASMRDYSELNNFYDIFLKIFYYHLKDENNFDMAMYFQFFSYFVLGNRIQNQDDWTKWNIDWDKYSEPYYEKYINKLSLRKCKDSIKPNIRTRKIRIALITDSISWNSYLKTEYEFFKDLMSDTEFQLKYEIAIYSMNYFEKSQDEGSVANEFYSIGVHIISPAKRFAHDGYYNNHLQKALVIRDAIVEDGIDIAIFTQHNHDISNFLLISRVAPLQIFWSYENNVFDINGIDETILDIDFKTKLKDILTLRSQNEF
jgi:hypothetical protein